MADGAYTEGTVDQLLLRVDPGGAEGEGGTSTLKKMRGVKPQNSPGSATVHEPVQNPACTVI